MNRRWPIYPDPICMICGKECDITEIVDTGMGQMELWCYCPKCDIDTFHPPITDPVEIERELRRCAFPEDTPNAAP